MGTAVYIWLLHKVYNYKREDQESAKRIPKHINAQERSSGQPYIGRTYDKDSAKFAVVEKPGKILGRKVPLQELCSEVLWDYRRNKSRDSQDVVATRDISEIIGTSVRYCQASGSRVTVKQPILRITWILVIWFFFVKKNVSEHDRNYSVLHQN